ncbi:MAG: acetyltransferase [Bryobacteraceae bacterium]|jgi:sugar O-acyltransferase (sialic acid O-acetyltransferase NeuD family)
MSDLVLWGAGGHGKVVLDVARALGGFGAVSFIDDAEEVSGREFCGCQVCGASRYLQSLKGQGCSQYLVAIGKNELRAACFQRALDRGLLPATLVHPSAVISESARLEEGTVVMANVAINAGARIGKNCIVNTAAVVEHDCRVGDHVHLSPGVLLGGGVTVHSFAHVGIGAIALPGAEIGEGATVGAGAVVLDSVPARTSVVGIPARVIARASR